MSSAFWSVFDNLFQRVGAHCGMTVCLSAFCVCSHRIQRYYTRYNPQTDNCPGMPRIATRSCIETTDLFEADG